MNTKNSVPPGRLEDDLAKVGIDSETPHHLRILKRQIDSVFAAGDLIVIAFRSHEIAKAFLETYAVRMYLDGNEIISDTRVSDLLFGTFSDRSDSVWINSPCALPSKGKLTIFFGKLGEDQVFVKEVEIP